MLKPVVRKLAIFAIISMALSPVCSGGNLLAAMRPLILEEWATLPEAKAGKEYSYQFRAEGGLPPLVWRVTQGELQQGLRLETSGKIIGAPLQAQQEPSRFAVEVTDSSQPPQRFTQTFSLQVQAASLRIVLNPSPARPELRIVPGAPARRTRSDFLQRLPERACQRAWVPWPAAAIPSRLQWRTSTRPRPMPRPRHQRQAHPRRRMRPAILCVGE